MRFQPIDSSFFIRNRKKISDMLKGKSVAIIHSNDEMHRSGDQHFTYRQNSNLYYLTGILQEKTILFLDPRHKDKHLQEVLFIRKTNKQLETWVGHKLTHDEARQLSGIENIRWTEDFNTFLNEQLIPAETIYYDIEEYPKFQPEAPYRARRLLESLKANFPLHRFERLFPLVSSFRMLKEPEEIEMIKRACKITRDGFIRALNFIRPGLKEYEIEAEFTYEFIRLGAGGHAYAPIIASGSNACVLHYTANDRECNTGELLLMDIGAEYAGYSSDMTRTIPVNGQFSERQRELYDSVLRVFRYARELMKPGNTINNLNKEVGKKWEEEHIRLQLYSADDLKEHKGDESLFTKFYPHGTSHFLGLDVHDVGSKDDEFKPGMVLTCEPGIYIPDEKTGIRIENDIIITDSGNIDLMDDIPVEPDEIEHIINH